MEEHLKHFVAGFELAGKRLISGKLRSCLERDIEIDDWPKEVTLFGHTYNLEGVTEGVEGYENADYC